MAVICLKKSTNNPRVAVEKASSVVFIIQNTIPFSIFFYCEILKGDMGIKMAARKLAGWNVMAEGMGLCVSLRDPPVCAASPQAA